jgi:hypothetical protein
MAECALVAVQTKSFLKSMPKSFMSFCLVVAKLYSSQRQKGIKSVLQFLYLWKMSSKLE